MSEIKDLEIKKLVERQERIVENYYEEGKKYINNL